MTNFNLIEKDDPYLSVLDMEYNSQDEQDCGCEVERDDLYNIDDY